MGLAFGELTNGQAVVHHSRHRLTSSATTWLRARTRQSMNNGLAGSVNQKLNRVGSVQLRRSVRAFTKLNSASYPSGALDQQRI